MYTCIYIHVYTYMYMYIYNPNPNSLSLSTPNECRVFLFSALPSTPSCSFCIGGVRLGAWDVVLVVCVCVSVSGVLFSVDVSLCV